MVEKTYRCDICREVQGAPAAEAKVELIGFKLMGVNGEMTVRWAAFYTTDNHICKGCLAGFSRIHDGRQD